MTSACCDIVRWCTRDCFLVNFSWSCVATSCCRNTFDLVDYRRPCSYIWSASRAVAVSCRHQAHWLANILNDYTITVQCTHVTNRASQWCETMLNICIDFLHQINNYTNSYSTTVMCCQFLSTRNTTTWLAELRFMSHLKVDKKSSKLTLKHISYTETKTEKNLNRISKYV